VTAARDVDISNYDSYLFLSYIFLYLIIIFIKMLDNLLPVYAGPVLV